ncbi:hypothetical protein IU500_31305 [Nocardia terpenica]|uniref:hypothetical protein n=1 Tax=Nocardia terpenica TaxID=455432 RepID=UPI00189320E2|nr:hypothetical protein [Nocardia terpenica]MBF6063841.1 hypothetical protein [Nocardia terpenica]MBF6108507.1 hypothetical protein [Nocardia terpenica]MBF6116053.1 hypothetical protein [Nocardia terpenica]MBF6121022.1 hypothetical protein [Nocardia terpenica]MBF6156706.1 hypothetical protein [Nocardia terpenica]
MGSGLRGRARIQRLLADRPRPTVLDLPGLPPVPELDGKSLRAGGSGHPTDAGCKMTTGPAID